MNCSSQYIEQRIEKEWSFFTIQKNQKIFLLFINAY